MSLPEGRGSACFETSELCIGYGPALIVQELDLSIPTGMFTALIGPNGSGKSTILRTLSGLHTPKRGTILLDGKSIASLPLREMAKRVGALSQGPVAPEGLTVLDLVRQGRYPHRSLFSQWSEQDTGACEKALSLTGMMNLRDQRVDQLSGGQRQRAWIAMTLAQETSIMLLDEPTTFLDLSHQIEVMELAANLVRNGDKTVVAVLHDLNQAARYANHMVMLKEGKVIASGPPKEVMTAKVIQDVFDVSAKVLPDPVTGTPMCIPIPGT
ncbi:ABC transporter ATP-binding protein [Roseibium algae]|uniref:ABC transporter ATP-binding protein n=1 Tax=Roseibium algae TaxID=3123038 RepID=A0ABU8TS70_9HYPH